MSITSLRTERPPFTHRHTTPSPSSLRRLVSLEALPEPPLPTQASYPVVPAPRSGDTPGGMHLKKRNPASSSFTPFSLPPNIAAAFSSGHPNPAPSLSFSQAVETIAPPLRDTSDSFSPFATRDLSPNDAMAPTPSIEDMLGERRVVLVQRGYEIGEPQRGKRRETLKLPMTVPPPSGAFERDQVRRVDWSKSDGYSAVKQPFGQSLYGSLHPSYDYLASVEAPDPSTDELHGPARPLSSSHTIVRSWRDRKASRSVSTPPPSTALIPSPPTSHPLAQSYSSAHSIAPSIPARHPDRPIASTGIGRKRSLKIPNLPHLHLPALPLHQRPLPPVPGLKPLQSAKRLLHLPHRSDASHDSDALPRPRRPKPRLTPRDEHRLVLPDHHPHGISALSFLALDPDDAAFDTPEPPSPVRHIIPPAELDSTHDGPKTPNTRAREREQRSLKPPPRPRPRLSVPAAPQTAKTASFPRAELDELDTSVSSNSERAGLTEWLASKPRRRTKSMTLDRDGMQIMV